MKEIQGCKQNLGRRAGKNKAYDRVIGICHSSFFSNIYRSSNDLNFLRYVIKGCTEEDLRVLRSLLRMFLVKYRTETISKTEITIEVLCKDLKSAKHAKLFIFSLRCFLRYKVFIKCYGDHIDEGYTCYKAFTIATARHDNPFTITPTLTKPRGGLFPIVNRSYYKEVINSSKGNLDSHFYETLVNYPERKDFKVVHTSGGIYKIERIHII